MADNKTMFQREAGSRQEAIDLAKNISESGITQNEVHSKYSKWAQNYDKDMDIAGYTGVSPFLVQEIHALLNGRKDATILDCACGTGIVGKELGKHGYVNVDGLDSNEEMLKICEKAEIYKKLILSNIGSEPMDIPNNSYDVVILCGALVPGHVSPECLIEFTRITKPNGLIAITRGMYQDRPDPPEIKHLEQISKQLEQQGKCRFLKRATDHVYFNKDPYNIYFYSPIE